MEEFLDPTYWYLILLAVVLAVAGGVSILAAQYLGVAATMIVVVLVGFVGGQLVVGADIDPFGAFIVAIFAAVLMAPFLPLSVEVDVGIFLLGFFTGLSTRRRF